MHRSELWLVLGVVALCGCGGVATVPENGPNARPAHASPTELTLQQPVHHLDGLAREPMVVQHPDGTLFVSGYGPENRGFDPAQPPKLWRSTDDGRTWLAHAAPGTRDWDPTFSDPTKVPRWVEPVAWDADGALYHLWSEGDDLVLGRSRDQGATWVKWIVANDRPPILRDSAPAEARQSGHRHPSRAAQDQGLTRQRRVRPHRSSGFRSEATPRSQRLFPVGSLQLPWTSLRTLGIPGATLPP